MEERSSGTGFLVYIDRDIPLTGGYEDSEYTCLGERLISSLASIKMDYINRRSEHGV
jgi:hypothetical protein